MTKKSQARQLSAEVKGRVNGRAMTLRMDMNAFAEYEEANPGKKAIDALNELDGDNPSFVTLRHLVWAGLKYHQEDATLRDAGDFLSQNPTALIDAVAAAAPAEGDAPAGDAVGNGAGAKA